jgi:hypothetical protein
MRRVWPAWLFLFLAAFFLTTAAVAKFWAPGSAERIPLDSFQVTLLTGNADKLDPATGKTQNMKVKIANITPVDDDKSTDSVVVFVTSTCVNEDVDNPPNCLPKSDPRMISVSKLNWPSDRHTAEAINDPSLVANDPPVEGLVNKWPFYPERRTYKVWDDTSKQATDATYVGETTVLGLKCYQYHQVITDAPIDLGNNIDGLYSLDEIYTIDAVTGKIINQQVHDVRTLKDGGATALDLTAEYTSGTIKDNVEEASSGGKQLKLITKTLPVVGLIAGLICLAIGIPWLLVARRSNRRTDDDVAPVAPTSTPAV